MLRTFTRKYGKIALGLALAGSASIPIYSVIQYNSTPLPTDLDPILTAGDAAALLKQNKRNFEAVQKLELLYGVDPMSNSDISSLIMQSDRVVLCKLALHGSHLFSLHPASIVSKNQLNLARKANEDNEEDLLMYQGLNSIFSKSENSLGALGFYDYVICDENDLNCLERDKFKKHWGRDQKIVAPLIKGIELTGSTDCSEFLEKDLLNVLLNIYLNHRADLAKGKNPVTRRVCQLVMKIMGNIAKSKPAGLDYIIYSPWWALLHEMINSPKSGEEPYWARKVVHNMLFALGGEEVCYSSDVIELHRPQDGEEPLVDIVLVHGIQGSGLTTWRSNDSIKTKKTKSWISEWLVPEIKTPVRVIASDYVSSFRTLRGLKEGLPHRARRLEKEFVECGIGQRPVLWIAHSLGGIIIKRILNTNPEILSKTVGILFISTPHRGSPLADFFGRFGNVTDDVKMLKHNNLENNKIHNSFLAIANDIPLFVSVGETIKHDIVRAYHMVPPESAFFEKGAFYHFNSNHIDISKAKDRNDPVFKVVKSFINDGIRIIKEENKK
uniref:GPI inositol-deacylase n=1 Tax=Rhabditophanes sp. KR3021 TaxID=114890 RepID=A0AC35TK78_9BILA